MQVLDFSKLSFAEQVRAVHDAAVLAGISSSELVSSIFLPAKGVLLEISLQPRSAQAS